MPRVLSISMRMEVVPLPPPGRWRGEARKFRKTTQIWRAVLAKDCNALGGVARSIFAGWLLASNEGSIGAGPGVADIREQIECSFSFVSTKGVLREGSLRVYPFERLFKRKHRKL